MTEIQASVFNLLKTLCAFLDEHNLRYYIVRGTLLGAVKYHGFVPWDDDVDIAMPRSDYERLLSFPDSAFASPFRLHELTRQDDYYELYAKFVDTSTKIHLLETQRRLGNDNHVWVDIFPLDGLPASGIKVMCVKYASILLRHIYRLSISFWTFPRNRLKNLFIKLIASHVSYKKVYGTLHRLISRCPFDSSQRVVSATAMSGTFFTWPKSVFGGGVKKAFEGEWFNAPARYDEYLTGKYGDYEVDQPESQRKTHLFVMDGVAL